MSLAETNETMSQHLCLICSEVGVYIVKSVQLTDAGN